MIHEKQTARNHLILDCYGTYACGHHVHVYKRAQHKGLHGHPDMSILACHQPLAMEVEAPAGLHSD